MPFISTSNSRTFLEQVIRNAFPDDTFARTEIYSNVHRVINPISKAILELQINARNAYSNFIPQLYNPRTLDLLYRVTATSTGTAVKGILDSTEYTLTPSAPNLDSFWYDELPSRLEIDSTNYKFIYPTGVAKDYLITPNKPIFASSLETNLFPLDATTLAAGTYTTGATGIISTGSSTFWGRSDTSAVFTNTDTSLGTAEYYIESTGLYTGTSALSFAYNFTTNFGFSLPDSIVFEYGYKGQGTATATGSVAEWYERAYLPFESTAEDATAFFRATIIETTATNTSLCSIADFSFASLQALRPDAVQNQGLNYAYVQVSNASRALNASTNLNFTPKPTTVIIEGLDENGNISSERIIIPYNGVHRSSKTYKEILSTQVADINPSTALVTVQLQDFASTQIENNSETFADEYRENPLFYGLSSTNGTSYLEYRSFVALDVEDVIDGHDAIESFFETEFLDSSTNSIHLMDFTYDESNQLIYAVSTATNKLFVYDSFIYYPQDSVVKRMDGRTTNTELEISKVELHKRYLQKGQSITVSPIWSRRYNSLFRHRWILQKPDQSYVGLTESGEVPVSSNFWIINFADFDEVEESRFRPEKISYTATDYGDYTFYLESEFNQGDEVVTSTDVMIFSVPYKLPLAELEYTNSLYDSTSLAGVDLNSKGQPVLGYYMTQNGYSDFLQEFVYNFKFDNYFYDDSGKVLYTREPYDSIKIEGL